MINDRSRQAFEEAENLIDEGDFSQAFEILNGLDNADDEYWHIMMGYCLYKKEKYTEAITHFDKVIESGASVPNVLYLRANCLVELVRYDDAKNDFERVIEVDPDTYDAFVGLGVVYESQGDVNSAVESYQRALKINSSSVVATRRLAAIRRP